MIEDMCQKVDTDIILWAHCTNPFVDEQIYDDALNVFLERDVEINDSLLSVVELKTHLWHTAMSELNHNIITYNTNSFLAMIHQYKHIYPYNLYLHN